MSRLYQGDGCEQYVYLFCAVRIEERMIFMTSRKILTKRLAAAAVAVALTGGALPAMPVALPSFGMVAFAATESRDLGETGISEVMAPDSTYTFVNTTDKAIDVYAGGVKLNSISKGASQGGFQGKKYAQYTYRVADTGNNMIEFAARAFTLTYESNGGSLVSSATLAAIPASLPTPTKTGFKFLGWYTDAGFTEKAVANTPLEGDTTLYAKWGQLFTVQLLPGENATGTVTTAQVADGEEYTLPACSFKGASGKIFDKWDKGAAGDKITITADTVITALWKDDDGSVPGSETVDGVTYVPVAATSPTCTASGNVLYYKGSDGKYYVKKDGVYTATTLADVTLPSLGGHSFNTHGICTRCGAYQYDYNPYYYYYYYGVPANYYYYPASYYYNGFYDPYYSYNGGYSSYYNSLFTTRATSSVLRVNSTVDGSTLKLSWNKISGASKYQIYLEKNGTYEKIKETTATSATFYNMTNGKRYKFIVRYVKKGGISTDDYSGAVAVSAHFKPVVQARVNGSKVTLGWNKVEGATKYAVYKVVKGGASKLGETSSNIIRINNVSKGTHSYIVRAYVNGKWTSMDTNDIVDVMV